MTAQTKTTIKGYFQTGDRPSQSDFIDFIDSYQDTNNTLNYLATASPNFASGRFFGTNGSGASFFDSSIIRVSAGTIKMGSFAVSSLNATPVGNLSPSTGAFTTVTADSVKVSGAVSAGTLAATGAITGASLQVTNTVSASSANFAATCKAGTLQADTITDYHNLYIQTPTTNADYDFVRSSPYAYAINQFRGISKDGNFTALFKKNGTTFFTQVFASAVTAISTSQSFAIGDTLSVTVSAVSGAVSGASIYARHTRAL